MSSSAHNHKEDIKLTMEYWIMRRKHGMFGGWENKKRTCTKTFEYRGGSADKVAWFVKSEGATHNNNGCKQVRFSTN